MSKLLAAGLEVALPRQRVVACRHSVVHSMEGDGRPYIVVVSFCCQ